MKSIARGELYLSNHGFRKLVLLCDEGETLDVYPVQLSEEKLKDSLGKTVEVKGHFKKGTQKLVVSKMTLVSTGFKERFERGFEPMDLEIQKNLNSSGLLKVAQDTFGYV